MDKMDNTVLNRYLNPATRGAIYEFLEKDGTTRNFVLVVSSQARATDKIISVLMLGDSPAGFDIVEIPFMDTTRYVHCGMVTYCGRTRLGRKMDIVDPEIMRKIDAQLAKDLGIPISDDSFYKDLYENLVDRLVGVYNESGRY